MALLFSWVPVEARESFVTQSLQQHCDAHSGSWSSAAAVAVGITITTAFQEARCLHAYWHQEPRSLLFHWSWWDFSWLLKLPVTCDGCYCSTTAVPLLQSAVMRARSRVLCHRGCWSTIAEISSVKSQRGGKILSDFLPVLSILTEQSGKCSFQVPPQKRAWKGWDVVENHRQMIYIEFKIFLLMGV